MILLDTSLLSLAFRRRKTATRPLRAVSELERLIREDMPVRVPGIVLQEILSGVRDELQFKRLRGLMEGFAVLAATAADHVEAARIANACRRTGVLVSAIDCLIAAQSLHANARLFAEDRDFEHMQSVCGLHLYAW